MFRVSEPLLSHFAFTFTLHIVIALHYYYYCVCYSFYLNLIEKRAKKYYVIVCCSSLNEFDRLSRFLQVCTLGRNGMVGGVGRYGTVSTLHTIRNRLY